MDILGDLRIINKLAMRSLNTGMIILVRVVVVVVVVVIIMTIMTPGRGSDQAPHL